MADTASRPPCAVCRGSGRVALFTTVVPCECRGDPAAAAVLDADVFELPWSVRTRKVLRTLGVHTVRQLLGVKASELAAVRHARPATLEEVAAALARAGFPGWPRR